MTSLEVALRRSSSPFSAVGLRRGAAGRTALGQLQSRQPEEPPLPLFDPRHQRDGEDGTLILVDTSPDLRVQLAPPASSSLDAVLYTHPHSTTPTASTTCAAS